MTLPFSLPVTTIVSPTFMVDCKAVRFLEFKITLSVMPLGVSIVKPLSVNSVTTPLLDVMDPWRSITAIELSNNGQMLVIGAFE